MSDDDVEAAYEDAQARGHRSDLLDATTDHETLTAALLLANERVVHRIGV